MNLGDTLEHYFTNNKDLRSEMRTINFEKNGIVFTFFSDLGVFSKDHIDYGSRLLVECVLKNYNSCESILDVGCGYGFIGIVLSKIFDCKCLMVDVNERAIHLCEKNISKNKVLGKVIMSNCYENVCDKYDLIVSNPPIRAGKKVVLSILKDASKFLKFDGSLWFVMRKDQGAKSIIKELSLQYNCEVVTKSKGFYVIKAKNR